MQLILPSNIACKIDDALVKAGRREIGGIIVGEHVDGDTFKIVDVSIQTSHGTTIHFERDPVLHENFLKDFFNRTGQNYRRFNYLGEWHSHPSFTTLPSADDIITMQSIVADSNVGVNFAILLIVRRNSQKKISVTATAFSRLLPPQPVIMIINEKHQIESSGCLFSKLHKWLKNWVS